MIELSSMSCKATVLVLLIMLSLVKAEPSHAGQSITQSDSLFTILDTNYIKDFTYKLTARCNLLFQNASLTLNSDYTDKIVYRPNVNTRIGLAGFWRWFGLGLSIENPVYKMDEEKYGSTYIIDLRANAFARNFAAEIFLQYYKGFYISYPERPDGTKYIIPDMETFSIGISAYWIYNPGRFSIRASYIQTELQRRSAGSLMVRPSFLYFHINSANGLIPPELIRDYNIPNTPTVTNGDFYTVGLSPGYAYTFVFLKYCYITATIFPGVALQFHTFINNEDKLNDNEFFFQLSGRLALGYNSDKWFLGGSIQIGFNEIPDKLSNASYNYDVAQFKLWGGTRFDIFKKKKK